MIQVNTHEAKSKLDFLISKVEREHERIRICRKGKPVALLIPIGLSPNPLKQHPKLMGVKIHGDLTATLDEEDWPCDLK